MKNLQVFPDGTVNLHYDGLSPRDLAVLIRTLQGNLQLIKTMPTDPITVFQKSVRLDRAKNELSFQLNWNAPLITIDLAEDFEAPEPNVSLSSEQYAEYLSLFETMTASFK